jgi:hypothetical protein
MAVCRDCGTDNAPGSEECKACGAKLVPPSTGSFARDMSDIGKRIGQDFEKAGEKFGKEMERRGSEFGAWWDRSLGIFSPLIVALFGIIGFLCCMLVVSALAEASDRPAFWNDLLDFLESYWWLFFLLWILAQVLHMAEVDRGHTTLGDLGEFIEDVLVIVFAIVLIGGYLVVLLRSSAQSSWGMKKQA